MANSPSLEKSNRVAITVSEDEMQAYLNVMPPAAGSAYTEQEILQEIQQAGIVYGLDKEKVSAVLRAERYNETICIAQGKIPIDGIDGYFEFFFETQKRKGPKILTDGSVDYSTYSDIIMVKEGDRLAVYHPAVASTDGITVWGTGVVAKPGRELAKIKGRNITVSPDGKLYTASTDGLLSYDSDDNRINVSDILLIEEDVSVNSGDINFIGDIYIKGNVLTGMTVKSEKGGITVDGYVEGATLVAKKDIVLKNGMQGNGRGKVACNGSVSGKFFEQTVVDAQGSVNANSIMNCDISSGEDVIVSGKLGIIVGGHVSAMRRVEATIIGNMAEAPTKIWAGIEGDLLALLSQTEKQIVNTENEVARLAVGIAKADEMLETETVPQKADEIRKKKMDIVRAKVERDARVIELQKKKGDTLLKLEKANAAKVVIRKNIFPGCSITINGVSAVVTEVYQHVEYSRRGAGIIVGNIGE